MDLQNKLEFFLFQVFSRIFSILGLRATRYLGKALGALFFYCIPIRKKVVIKNLKIAFPGYPSSQISRLARKNYEALGMTFAEILYLPALTKERLVKEMKFPNIEDVRKVLQRGKGLVMMTAHFGNWEYSALSMGLQLGNELAVIVKNQRNPYVDKWMNDVRTRWGNAIVPLGISIKEIMQRLRDKKPVAMAADQRGPEEGIRVQFFNTPSAVFTGPAALALKCNAPLIIGFPIRLPDYTYEMKFYEISMEGLPANQNDAVQELTQRHTTILEDIVRKYPDQWFWMHNRWKY
ncbi:MAG: lysophospholipid acyltransferase family protein [Ignavibacteria bacterium]|nr:lysophospholipid acyltransferase family protein [Ignavibacteria bacterium]